MAKGQKSFGNMADGLFTDQTTPKIPESTMIKEQAPKKPELKNSEKLETKQKRPSTKSGLVQRAYYIKDEQYKALKLIAIEKETDTSSLVREALDTYIKKCD